MSFFGITALGPPNCFSAGLVNALGVNVFSDEEFEASFRRMDKDGSGAITPNEVEDLLYDTYGFPPLEQEVELFMKEFDINQDGKVTFEEFKASVCRLREKTNTQALNAKEYSSYNAMMKDRFKHKRMDKEPTEKYKLPFTHTQRVGFYVDDEEQRDIARQTNYPIRKCPETKYADSMIKTGFMR